MAIASKYGVESVTLEGTLRDEIVLIGEDVDVPCLTKRLRDKFGHASIVTIEDKEKLEKEEDEKKKKEEDELKKFKDEEEKDKKEAEFTAEREKNELECYRRMQNPYYITQHNMKCNFF
ncbi:hypothetical protein ZOSMA_207G00190 [Zostera marina]|uniref:HMA domain-containing protein n=1 Tax=Zostera marina TaxID=29655 RepID=A0A0K9PNH4_ZOSMR|nr:hypothetical protein ZOSMA_207G00190 [Zostera marina]